MIELLLDTPLVPAQRDYAETVRTSAESLLAILDDILDLSRVEAGRIALEEVDFAPEETVEDVCALLAAKADQKGIELCRWPSHRRPCACGETRAASAKCS